MLRQEELKALETTLEQPSRNNFHIAGITLSMNYHVHGKPILYRSSYMPVARIRSFGPRQFLECYPMPLINNIFATKTMARESGDSTSCF